MLASAWLGGLRHACTGADLGVPDLTAQGAGPGPRPEPTVAAATSTASMGPVPSVSSRRFQTRTPSATSATDDLLGPSSDRLGAKAPTPQATRASNAARTMLG